MSRDPAFLFYPGDWLGGTMCFTLEEKGAYLELLILQFNQGKFTEAQAKHMLSKCEASVWQNIKHKFINKGGYYYQERLQSEIEKRRNFSQSRKNNALGSNKPKTYAEHMEDENENINENKKETKIEKIIPPKIENVKEYFKERGFENEADRFFDFYTSKNWMVGKSKMVDWKASVRNWLRGKEKPQQSESDLDTLIKLTYPNFKDTVKIVSKNINSSEPDDIARAMYNRVIEFHSLEFTEKLKIDLIKKIVEKINA